MTETAFSALPSVIAEMMPALQMQDGSESRWLSMSNVVARAAQSLTLAEKRLISLGLSNTDSRSRAMLHRSINVGWKMTITAQDYARAFDVEDHTAYDQVKRAADAIFQREVRIETKSAQGKTIVKRLRWISAAIYIPGSGSMEMNFTPEIVPHLLGLASHFTQYQLAHTAAFQSVYAWRVFEILKSWQDKRGCTMTIEEFWNAIEAVPSARRDFTQLRLRVLEPSIREINEKTPFDAEWTAIRGNTRKVTALKFVFREKAQACLDLDMPLSP